MEALKKAVMAFDYISVENIVAIIEDSNTYSVHDAIGIINCFIIQTYQVKDVALQCKRMRIIASMLELCSESNNIQRLLVNTLVLADHLGDSDASKILTVRISINEPPSIGTAITDANIDLLKYYDMVKLLDISLPIAALYVSMYKNDERTIVSLLKDICEDACYYKYDNSQKMRVVNAEINRRLIYLLYLHLNDTVECKLLIS